MKGLPGNVSIRRKLSRQCGRHGTALGFDQAHIRAFEPMVARAGDCVYEHTERDADRIEKRGFSAAVLSHEDRQLLVQMNRALRKAPEVMQVQTIHAQKGTRAHSFPARSRSALISKLIEETPQP